jgi:hypothetical protein
VTQNDAAGYGDAMRALGLLAVVFLLAGCGGSSGAHKKATHQQPKLVARLTGKAAEKIGATACRHLPNGTLPANASVQDKVAALRAYLQAQHPTDDVDAMVKGCRSELDL